MKEIVSMYQNLIAKHLANTGIQYELVLKRRIENNEGVVTLILKDGSNNALYIAYRTNKSLELATHAVYNDFIDHLFKRALESIIEEHYKELT